AVAALAVVPIDLDVAVAADGAVARANGHGDLMRDTSRPRRATAGDLPGARPRRPKLEQVRLDLGDRAVAQGAFGDLVERAPPRGDGVRALRLVVADGTRNPDDARLAVHLDAQTGALDRGECFEEVVRLHAELLGHPHRAGAQQARKGDGLRA